MLLFYIAVVGAAGSGLSLSSYNNTAFVGPAASTTLISSLAFQLNGYVPYRVKESRTVERKG
jgi:hypothetical protein